MTERVFGNGGNMAEKQPTKRAILLRQRAARAMEKGLPDQVRRAYGDAPSVLADLPSDDPHLAAIQENARASLLKQGYLTEEELDTLSVDEAIDVVQQRMRAESVSLQEQLAVLTRQEKGDRDRVRKAPRTLRQG
jgi:multidrug resistance efflux pump